MLSLSHKINYPTAQLPYEKIKFLVAQIIKSEFALCRAKVIINDTVSKKYLRWIFLKIFKNDFLQKNHFLRNLQHILVY